MDRETERWQWRELFPSHASILQHLVVDHYPEIENNEDDLREVNYNTLMLMHEKVHSKW